MKIQILGCGTSTGVPVPGCTCAVCTSLDPKNNRTRTSARIITDEGKTILIDAGIDFRAQCLQNKIASIDSVLFTHHHSDHILGIDDLRGFNFIIRKAIPCYGVKTTLDEVQRIFSYLFDKDSDYKGGMLTSLELNPIEYNKPFEVCGERCIPFLLWHGTVPVTGFRFRDTVYATDCNNIPQESKEIMQGAKLLFLDGLRYREHYTHFTIPQAVTVADELGIEQTYLIHMSHDVEYAEANRNLPAHVQLAYDGLTLSV